MKSLLSDDQFENFKSLLNETYDWPAVYCFKFIVKKNDVNLVQDLFPDIFIEKKVSKKGNYVSCTVSIELPTADHVIAIYQVASKIEGVISL